MLTLYRAGYSLAGITILYISQEGKKAALHAYTLKGWILTRRYNNTVHLTRRNKKQPSMLKLYRAGYSLAGITIHLTQEA
jgi:hypothetical protein